jgi:hypothetical protein
VAQLDDERKADENHDESERFVRFVRSAGQGKIALISSGYIDMWAIAAERKATMIG